MNYENSNLGKEKFTELESLVREVIFKGKEEIKFRGETILFNDCKIFSRVSREKDEPDRYYLVLGPIDSTDMDEAITFGVWEKEKVLVTDFIKNIPITDEQIKIIKLAAGNNN